MNDPKLYIKAFACVSAAKRVEINSILLASGGAYTDDPEILLTPRQLDVFRMIGEGKTSREIADAMNLSVKTIETHKDNIRESLRVGNYCQLTVAAARWVMKSENSSSLEKQK